MNKKLKISGIAVKSGTSRNKRKYIAKELEKFAPSLTGRPILKDHEGYTDNVIGKVTESMWDPKTESVKYSGWIKDDSVSEKIRDGRITEVSIGAIAGKVVKESKDDDVIIPVDMEALELSTTPVPGNKGTSVTFENIEYSEKEIEKIIKDYEKNSYSSCDDSYIIKKEDNVMESTKVSEDNNENVELETLKAEKEALLKEKESLEKEKAEFLEQKRQDAIKKYKSICESKNLKPKDLSDSDIAKINFAIEMVEDLPDPEEDEEEEEKAEPEKEEAEPESEDKESEEADESFENYVVTTENVVGPGVAFYKYY